jgi:hypothetical protein
LGKKGERLACKEKDGISIRKGWVLVISSLRIGVCLTGS